MRGSWDEALTGRAAVFFALPRKIKGRTEEETVEQKQRRAEFARAWTCQLETPEARGRERRLAIGIDADLYGTHYEFSSNLMEYSLCKSNRNLLLFSSNLYKTWDSEARWTRSAMTEAMLSRFRPFVRWHVIVPLHSKS